jgi:prepilin-type N-terminal cleavage/methylation domain-containing protein
MRKGFTIVELIISLALLSALFVLLGSLLHGMSRLTRLSEDNCAFDRELNFCISLMRKELGEMQVDQNLTGYRFLSGDNFLAYSTTRQELLARNSIPGGIKRVEWRYDPQAKVLVRTVSMLIDGRRELTEPGRTTFLEGLEGFETRIFDGVNWLRMTGISELVPKTGSISVRFLVADSKDSTKTEYLSSTFILPNETYIPEK